MVSGAFLLTGLLAVSPSTVEAACEQWNVGGQWGIQQSNGAKIVMNLRQNGTSVTGTAAHTNASVKEDRLALPGIESFGADTQVDGAVTGTMEGDDFYVEISWAGGKLIGAYRGKVSPAGRIQGSTYDIAKPSSKAKWFSTSAIKCPEANPIKPSSVLTPAPPAPSPKPKVIKSTGRSPLPAPSQVTTNASATISVSPEVVRLSPGQDQGTATLTWDGGINHPNIKLTVKSESHNPFALRQPQKGTREIKVDKGTTTFALTDANSGEWLATATVQAKEASGTEWDQSRNPRRRRPPSNGENQD
jgi:hypothetical protein